MRKIIISFLALLIAALSGGVVAENLGGSPGNLPATIATTSTISVSDKGVNVLIATTTSSFGSAAICSARIISTAADPIRIASAGINDIYGTTSLQLGQGIFQAASTTIVYSSNDFGCDAWIVKGAGASATTTITITETRQ